MCTLSTADAASRAFSDAARAPAQHVPCLPPELWANILEHLLPPEVQHRDYRTVGAAGAAHAFAQQVVLATSELSSLIVAISPAGMQNLVDLRLLYSPLDSRTPTLLALDNIAACHNLRRLALEHVHISCKRKATFPRLEELVMSNVWLHDFNRSRFAGDAFPALRAFCTTPMTMHSSQDLGLARGCPHLSPALLAQLDVI